MLCLYPLFAAFLLCIDLVTALTLPRDGNLLARQTASPSCSTATLSGWARFPQYDYNGHDLNRFTSTSETACLQGCIDQGAACTAVLWRPSDSLCLLKQDQPTAGAITPTDRPGAVLSVRGTCGSLQPFSDQAQQAACCNTVASQSFPSCTPTVAGYAQFPMFDYNGHDLTRYAYVPSEWACVYECIAYGPGCTGTFFRGSDNACLLKTGTPDPSSLLPLTASALAGSVAELKGSCEMFAATMTDAQKNACCDTVDNYDIHHRPW